MLKKRMTLEQVAFLIRIGVGMVMLSGGLSKLLGFLNPSTQTSMVQTYLATDGYVNEFFITYLFQSGLISPWLFLTSLSAVEFLGGVLLLIGLAVRPISLIFAFMFLSFVAALPVATIPIIADSVSTHTSPALLIMIRDIALSGMLFALYNLGSGLMSVDKKHFGASTANPQVSWQPIGLLLRLSLGIVFVVGGAFYGLPYIASFASPWLLLPIGILLLSGHGVKYAGYASIAVIGWYMTTKLHFDNSLIANMNAVKREFALLALAIVLSQLGGGNSHTALGMIQNILQIITRSPDRQQKKAEPQ